MRRKGAGPQVAYTYTPIHCSELASGLDGSWAEFMSGQAHPCTVVPYSYALRPESSDPWAHRLVGLVSWKIFVP